MTNNHEELRWQKGWWDKIEGWKNKIKACDDLDGVSDEMAEENLNSGKEKMKTLRTRI